MAQATTALTPKEENQMAAELDEMARQLPLILRDIQRDREEGERWLKRSRERRQQTNAILGDIEELLKRL